MHRRQPGRRDRQGTQRWRLVGLLWCAATLAGASIALFVGGVVSSAPAQGATTPYLTLSVTPPHDLITGEKITLTVKVTPTGVSAGLELTRVSMGWCNAGSTLPQVLPKSGYMNLTNALPLGSLGSAGPVCTTATHPTLNTNAIEPVSAISPKTATATSVTGPTFAQVTDATAVRNGTIACDAAHPCTFAVGVYVLWKTPASQPSALQTGAIYFLSAPVTFLPSTLSQSCGGYAGTQLASAAPDQFAREITKWTLAGCQTNVGGGKALASVSSSGSGDLTALCQFASGEEDFAYGGAGYGSTSSPFNPAQCPARTGGAEAKRSYVAIPVALNAMVLGHTQTIKTTNNVSQQLDFADYARLTITDVQAAQLLGADGSTLSWAGTSKGPTSLGPALVKEDPTLVKDQYYTTTTITTSGNNPISHQNRSNSARGVVVTSGTNATILFGTQFFQAVVPPATWVSPAKVGPTRTHPPLAAGASFSLATPPYDVRTVTGETTILHYLTPGVAARTTGMPWAFLPATDADALWFGMANASLQLPGTTPPVYVSPTTKTAMQAAVANMIPQSDGTLVPNPTGKAVGGHNPYPLTFVEYVFAPTQPLMGPTCTLRTQAESHLIAWLNYITGAGQTHLVKGLAPLPASLQETAASAITQVGESPPGCIPATVTTTLRTSTTLGAGGAGGTTKKTAAGTTSTTTAAGPGAAHGGTSSSGSSGGGGVAYGSGGRYSSANGSSSTGSLNGGAGTTPASVNGSTSTAHKSLTTATDLSDFKQVEGPGWLLPVLAVIVLFVLVPGMALLVSGRSPNQLLELLRGQPVGHDPPGGSS